jgi:tripartite-type tricarboxylate transporter receptor subunit TctC
MVMALLTLSLISGLVGVSKSLAADAFPSKEITFVCPWPPGGSSDLLSRAIAQSANKHLPKPMVVINRDGANGMVATTEMAKTKADGYAVSLGTSGLFLAQPYTQKSLGYKQDDFDFLVGFTNEPILLSVQSSSPYKTLEDLLTGVKKDNKVISYSNSGIGGFPQLALGYLFQLAGVKSQPIPFKGGAPAITALLGGHVDALACHPGEAIPHVKAGTIRPLAVSSPSRFPDLPNVPTMKEKGFNVDIGVRKFVFAPKGLPPEARSGLVGVLQKVLKDPGFQKSMADIYLMVDPMTGEQVVSYFSAQAPVMKELLKDMVKK